MLEIRIKTVISETKKTYISKLKETKFVEKGLKGQYRALKQKQST